jgi:hypothetical protein
VTALPLGSTADAVWEVLRLRLLRPFMGLSPRQQQKDHVFGGLSVFAAQREMIEADPEGQQNGHNPKHPGMMAAPT